MVHHIQNHSFIYWFYFVHFKSVLYIIAEAIRPQEILFYWSCFQKWSSWSDTSCWISSDRRLLNSYTNFVPFMFSCSLIYYFLLLFFYGTKPLAQIDTGPWSASKTDLSSQVPTTGWIPHSRIIMSCALDTSWTLAWFLF